MVPARPDPDELLVQLRADEARAVRGKLRIYFGSSAGVGKTYAMLAAGRQLKASGLDIVAGIVETHGRAETAAQLLGLDVLPASQLSARGRTLPEFDLDAALKRRPALILVDELAHSNAAGSRHPKRWQDVEELLDAGIDVYTTLNVQHLESLNDVVGGITGIRVWETVPDHVFDDADEVVLVDLPTDDLLKRLQEGRIYLPGQAERAVQNFFRKGNLMALRELALRRTADRIDDDVRHYRREHMGIEGQRLWQASDALLVCVAADPGADRLVRAASRRANRSTAPWHAVYVETPALQRLPEARRRAILQTLKLAESLGAETATLSGSDAARVTVAYAREHSLGSIVWNDLNKDGIKQPTEPGMPDIIVTLYDSSGTPTSDTMWSRQREGRSCQRAGRNQRFARRCRPTFFAGIESTRRFTSPHGFLPTNSPAALSPGARLRVKV